MATEREAWLLELADAVRALPGVDRVTILRAGPNLLPRLIVSLQPTGEPAEPTVVCVQCGRVILEGSDEISHGLCEECAPRFVEGARGGSKGQTSEPF